MSGVQLAASRLVPLNSSAQTRDQVAWAAVAGAREATAARTAATSQGEMLAVFTR